MLIMRRPSTSCRSFSWASTVSCSESTCFFSPWKSCSPIASPQVLASNTMPALPDTVPCHILQLWCAWGSSCVYACITVSQQHPTLSEYSFIAAAHGSEHESSSWMSPQVRVMRSEKPLMSAFLAHLVYTGCSIEYVRWGSSAFSSGASSAGASSAGASSALAGSRPKLTSSVNSGTASSGAMPPTPSCSATRRPPPREASVTSAASASAARTALRRSDLRSIRISAES
mmetsp:Transcript_14677/g.33839  ORF Transcript_14677/g.33839 Transcript_14677/m.33839 type:complete len:229 (+) Transcript_14677:521-1207(+)